MAGRDPQVFLIHGSDAARVHQERARLVSDVLPREHRAENLTEIEPPGNRPLLLRRIAADLISELATPSFFPEARRVVVVEQLADLVGGASRSGGQSTKTKRRGKSKTKSPDEKACEALCRFIERDLPETTAILIFSAIEEPEKYRRIRTNWPLYKTIQSVGKIVQFKQSPAIFKLTDAFGNRDLGGALQALSEVLDQDDGVGAAFRMLNRHVRFLIQAKLIERLDSSEEEGFADRFFPADKGLNLTREHSFSISKIRRMAARWSLAELNALLPQFERLIKVVYPSSADVYVPDPQIELERLVLQACRSGTAAPRKRSR